MSKNDYVKPPKDSVLKKAAGGMKGAYAYLHPDYRTRKLLHLIIIVPVMFLTYGLIWGLIFMDVFHMNSHTIPLYAEVIDWILIIGSTILGAYFYPFSRWWYKQSALGTELDNMLYIGSISGILIRKAGFYLFGIIFAVILAPVIGPLVLRKCRKKNMIIGEDCDFK